MYLIKSLFLFFFLSISLSASEFEIGKEEVLIEKEGILYAESLERKSSVRILNNNTVLIRGKREGSDIIRIVLSDLSNQDIEVSIVKGSGLLKGNGELNTQYSRNYTSVNGRSNFSENFSSNLSINPYKGTSLSTSAKIKRKQGRKWEESLGGFRLKKDNAEVGILSSDPYTSRGDGISKKSGETIYFNAKDSYRSASLSKTSSGDIKGNVVRSGIKIGRKDLSYTVGVSNYQSHETYNHELNSKISSFNIDNYLGHTNKSYYTKNKISYASHGGIYRKMAIEHSYSPDGRMNEIKEDEDYEKERVNDYVITNEFDIVDINLDHKYSKNVIQNIVTDKTNVKKKLSKKSSISLENTNTKTNLQRTQRTYLGYSTKIYDSGELSLSVGEQRVGKNSSVSAKAQNRLNLGDLRIVSALMYAKTKNINNNEASLNISKKIGKEYKLNAGVRFKEDFSSYSFGVQNKLTRVMGTYSKVKESNRWSLNYSTNIGVNGISKIVSSSIDYFNKLSIRSYLDRNLNNVFDKEDVYLSEVSNHLYTNKSKIDDKKITSDNGLVVFRSLKSNEGGILSLNHKDYITSETDKTYSRLPSSLEVAFYEKSTKKIFFNGTKEVSRKTLLLECSKPVFNQKIELKNENEFLLNYPKGGNCLIKLDYIHNALIPIPSFNIKVSGDIVFTINQASINSIGRVNFKGMEIEDSIDAIYGDKKIVIDEDGFFETDYKHPQRLKIKGMTCKEKYTMVYERTLEYFCVKKNPLLKKNTKKKVVKDKKAQNELTRRQKRRQRAKKEGEKND
ncbi:MAG: hypothetical protein GY909_15740 [Oligoflexia bacterium]|nr:hypothetical protein [Oligoflexia bacterium]